MKQFRTKIRSEKVSIDDQTDWSLIELSGKERDEFLMELKSRYVDSTGKLSNSIIKVKGLQAFLISMCLRTPAGDIVPIEVIQQWPAETVLALYEYCIDKNGLGENAREQGKKESAAKDPTGSESPLN